jgi:hypothetical protein
MIYENDVEIIIEYNNGFQTRARKYFFIDE